jgi:septal ring factor EnvC (AmiA/AmiB activator)
MIKDPVIAYVAGDLARKRTELEQRKDELAKLRTLLETQEKELHEAEAVDKYLMSRLKGRRDHLSHGGTSKEAENSNTGALD